MEESYHRGLNLIQLSMESLREEIAKEVEDAIRPLMEQPGFMNALGTLTIALKVIRGEDKKL